MLNLLIKGFSFLFLLFTSFLVWGETPVLSYEKNDKGGFSIFVENNNVYPVTLKIKPELENMLAEYDNEHLFIVPAKEKKYYLTTFNIDKAGKKYSFKYNYNFVIGDASLPLNKSFIYQLPFAKGESFKLFQGYNGSFSHQGKKELDFSMPVGTRIFAARDGMVIEVVDINNKGCPEKDCVKFNNYIKILHDDGTIAHYLHIKQNSSLVKTGQLIKKNNPIAESGNVGWSSGPHLHFSITKPGFEQEEGVETKFLILGSEQPIVLKEGEYYSW